VPPSIFNVIGYQAGRKINNQIRNTFLPRVFFFYYFAWQRGTLSKKPQKTTTINLYGQKNDRTPKKNQANKYK